MGGSRDRFGSTVGIERRRRC